MKKLKIILSTMLAFMFVIMPFVLVGCKDNVKKYTVSVTKAEGEGYVYKQYPETRTAVPLAYGDNDYAEGSVVELYVVPESHYQVKSIQVKKGNGDFENIDFSVAETDKETGIVRKTITTGINTHYGVKVAFELRVYELTFYYWDGSAYQELKDGTETYKICKTNPESITITGIKDFGFLWYARLQGGDIDSELSAYILSSDEITLTRDTALYTPKTASALSDLQSLLGIE